MQHKATYIWGILSRFVPQGLYLVTNIVLARLLSPDDFGTIGVLAVVFMVANVLIESGLGGSLVKEDEISELDCSTISVFNVFVGVFLYVLVFILAGYIEDYFNISRLKDIIRVIGLIFIIDSFAVVPRAILTRELQFKKIFYGASICVCVASLASIVSASLMLGVYSLVIYRIAYSVTNVVFCYSVTKYRFRLKFSLSSFKRIAPFGVFTTICSAIDTIYENVLTTVTGKFLNVKEAGYVYQSKQLEEALSSSFASSIASVAFPILTKDKHCIEKFKKETYSIFKLVIALISPVLISVAIFSDEIISVVLGEKWLPASYYLSLLMIAGVFLVMENLNRVFIKSTGRVKELIYITLIKRTVGIAIIIVTLCIDCNYVIFAYIVSTFTAYLFNQKIYTKIIGVGYVESLWFTIMSCVPGILFLAVELVLKNVTILNIGEQIVLTFFVTIAYYLIVSRINNISLGKYFKKR